MSVCGFHGLNEDDLNALVDVFGLDVSLKINSCLAKSTCRKN